MKITLLANAGVLVEQDGVRVMVDGLYRRAGHPFPGIPREMEERLMAGNPPVDLLCCTHLHPDHFDGERMGAYLERNRVRGALLPAQGLEADGVRAVRDLLARLEGEGVPHRAMAEPVGGGGSWRALPGVELTWFNTGHMGPQFVGEANHCLLVDLGGKRLLVTGDADMAEEIFRARLAGRKVDAALINPLFGQSAKGRAILREIVKPGRVVYYHLPDPAGDPWGLRRMVERQMGRWQGEAYAQSALLTPGQTELLSGRPTGS